MLATNGYGRQQVGSAAHPERLALVLVAGLLRVVARGLGALSHQREDREPRGHDCAREPPAPRRPRALEAHRARRDCAHVLVRVAAHDVDPADEHPAVGQGRLDQGQPLAGLRVEQARVDVVAAQSDVLVDGISTLWSSVCAVHCFDGVGGSASRLMRTASTPPEMDSQWTRFLVGVERMRDRQVQRQRGRLSRLDLARDLGPRQLDVLGEPDVAARGGEDVDPPGTRARAGRRRREGEVCAWRRDRAALRQGRGQAGVCGKPRQSVSREVCQPVHGRTGAGRAGPGLP